MHASSAITAIPILALLFTSLLSFAELTAKHDSRSGTSQRGQKMLVYNPFSRPANQDKKHFPLGECQARPAAGYFADVAGLDSEQIITDTIAGLSSEREIQDTLVWLLKDRWMAFEYMRWRLRMKK